jgi:hypothetical protein
MKNNAVCLPWITLSTLLVVGSAQAPAADPALDHFESRIRPLLLERCQGCHSGATGKTSGGLALDTRAGWLKGSDSGPVIVPGDPDASLLVAAIRSGADGARMPPEDHGGPLAQRDVDAVVAWIAAGAPDPREGSASLGGMTPQEARGWWAFQPLVAVVPPDVSDAGWPRGDIDRFVRKAQEIRGIEPLEDADRRTLLRRATFDLTGLPPTPEEIADFLADGSPDAFSRVVDRLLDSPAYGERWGRHWLDVARYADTAGDGADYPVREAGRYRDWVVAALNADQPFDEFVRDQIAGDIRAASGPAKDYASRVTATGFLAIGKRYGYAPKPTYQHLDFADTIDSLGRALLGLSLGCARCHDHKYDPVTMADYYGLYGIMQSSKWAFPGGEEHKRPADFVPLVPAAEAARLDAEHATRLRAVDTELAAAQIERARLDPNWWAGGVDLAFEAQKPGSQPAAAWLGMGPNVVVAEAQSPFTHIHPAGTRGVRMGTGKPNEGVRHVFAQPLRTRPGGRIHLAIDFRTVAPAEHGGAYRFYVGRGVVESLALECSVSAREFAVRSGGEWRVVRSLEPGTWYTLACTIDGDHRTISGTVGTSDDRSTFADIPVAAAWDGVVDTFICDGIGHVAGPSPARDLDNLAIQEEPFAAVGTAVNRPAAPADATTRITGVDARIAELKQSRESLVAAPPYPVAYGVSEGRAGPARIQKRGEPHLQGDEVPRRWIDVLGGDSLPAEGAGSGRLQLADWVTRSSAPLVARVFVNRVWQWHFGRGIVPTPSDFGNRGEPPSHPELLEWLAHEFVASGWRLKPLHRRIMLSRTYQLSGGSDAEIEAVDPESVWLWRYVRRRLDAESIRDAMLFVSGQLDRSVPDCHPFPDVATWGFTIHKPFHAEYDSNHRSLYLMVQRNRRHPYLALFDAADPNQSIDRRLTTTTPTQALYLMNSPFVHRQAEAFAARLDATGDAEPRRIERGVEMASGFRPDAADRDQCAAFLASYREGLVARGSPTDQADAQAWAALCRVLLTDNAFLSVD